MKRIFICKKGLTLLELVIVCIVFSLFLFAVFATLDIGLKSWQLGATKSDLHQKAEIVLNRISRELSYSSILSVEIENNGNPSSTNEYISFETPFNNGSFECDNTNYGSPLWQGFILYYIQPLKSGWVSGKRDLFRQYVPRTDPDVGSVPSIHPDLMGDLTINLKMTNPVSENLRTIIKDIYSIDFERIDNLVKIEAQFIRHIRTEASVSFAGTADESMGNETVVMSVSVRPKN